MPQKTIRERVRAFFTALTQWMVPGLGVKRWIIVLFIGVLFVSVGSAFFLLEIYRSASNPWWVPILSAISLQQLARPIRILIFGAVGVGILLWGLWGLNHALVQPFIRPGQTMVDTLTRHRRKERGPRIVAIGGGHGLSTLLRGLKRHTSHLTAIVTVADDGGSSGRLRRSLGILPPGDIRNCLAALSDEEDLLSQLFQYRFAQGGDAGVEGHSFGNLFISALTHITGSFEGAVTASGRVLAVSGKVFPSTLQDVTLVADMVLPHSAGEVRVAGESQIPEMSGRMAGKVRRVWLEPNTPSPYPKAVQAILSADLIVVGPGSLYTSILPNLLVPDITAAIRASRGVKMYVCNVATQPGETQGYSVGDHLRALEEHVGKDLFDLILCNRQMDAPLPAGVEWVEAERDLLNYYHLHFANVVDDEYPWRHDSEKLAQTIVDILQERMGGQVG
ncbi:MAG TPA: YvcK family protein [Anaerolineales bacterium]|nr:YvcK family protein [Anaerolineales bacterium]